MKDLRVQCRNVGEQTLKSLCQTLIITVHLLAMFHYRLNLASSVGVCSTAVSVSTASLSIV